MLWERNEVDDRSVGAEGLGAAPAAEAQMGGVVSGGRCWVLTLSSFCRFWTFMIIS